MTSDQDKATQGWRWAEDDDLPAYVLESPDGTRWQITKDFAHPDELLAALQRPEREAALVEALKELLQWALHGENEGAVCGVCGFLDGKHYYECPTKRAKALISPPGLSEGV